MLEITKVASIDGYKIIMHMMLIRILSCKMVPFTTTVQPIHIKVHMALVIRLVLLLIAKIKKFGYKNGTYVSGENPTTGSGGMQSVSGKGAIPDGTSIQW